jgi:alkanesulfonate monooxygenase SsuD/methylene tetrahydromethanopterin reductase-like flavin-dependent oxidoreductase (luciferase family)
MGFDSLWTLDHLLPTSQVHSTSWYDPLVSLAAAAAVTESIELGTASLVLGFRHPFALAKQLATLAAIAGPRVALGASSGWYEQEYTLFGYEMRERGRRTDESLRMVRRLLDEPVVTASGEYWPMDRVTLVPRPSWRLPILVGGGSRQREAGSEYDRPTIADSVLARIVAHDGWLAPCSGAEELTLADLTIVRDAVSRARKDAFRYLHVQWIYLVPTDDREKALATQLPALRTIMGHDRTDEHLSDCYLTGSVADIAARLTRLEDAGFHDLILGPVSSDPEQLELIAEFILPQGQATASTEGRPHASTPAAPA